MNPAECELMQYTMETGGNIILTLTPPCTASLLSQWSMSLRLPYISHVYISIPISIDICNGLVIEGGGIQAIRPSHS